MLNSLDSVTQYVAGLQRRYKDKKILPEPILLEDVTPLLLDKDNLNTTTLYFGVLTRGSKALAGVTNDGNFQESGIVFDYSVNAGELENINSILQDLDSQIIAGFKGIYVVDSLGVVGSNLSMYGQFRGFEITIYNK